MYRDLFLSSLLPLTVVFGCSAEKHILPEPISQDRAAAGATIKVYDCAAADEFVTTMTFLRHAKEMQIAEPDARNVALAVASGCTGAAGRFINVVELLRKSGLDSASAISLGRDAAVQDDEASKTFQVVFKKTFLKDYLDLDLADAVRTARSLSFDFHGNSQMAREDFETMVDFCVKHRQLDLPKPWCAQLAARVATYGEKTANEKVAKSFIDGYDYLNDRDGPALTTADSLKVAEALVAISPYAIDNFHDAYKYAVAKSGMQMQRADAVRFAQLVAQRTVSQTTAPR